MTSPSIPHAPPPWHTLTTAYLLPFYNSSSSSPLPSVAYSPLEAGSPFAEDAGTYKGGLCMAQILRYSDSPVGPYDELAIIPGAWEVEGKGKDGKVRKMRDMRITGIWVSRVETLVNGRRNWGIPKHLARFVFTPSDGTSAATKVEVFRPDATAACPFFTAKIHPVKYSPSFPFKSNWFDYVGISTYMLQPPLPQGEPSDIEVKTEKWLRSKPVLKSGRARLVWLDMKQGKGGNDAGAGTREDDNLLGKEQVQGEENWWPELRRWNLGLFCPDASLDLGEPEILDV